MNTRTLAFMISFFSIESIAQPQFELSRNIYRSPYANGQSYTVRQDHFTHNPEGRYDLRADGTDDCFSHQVVAAAAGVVRYKVESNDTSCTSGCGGFNNYVWISHANGEWTKYTHFRKNSVGVSVGDTVCAGEFLGYECSIGSTSPAYFRHLHFEVRAPNDPVNPPIDPSGGFLDPADGAHRIPVISGIGGKGFWEKDDEFTAAASACAVNDISYGALTIGNGQVKVVLASGNIIGALINFNNGSNGFFNAGNSITFTPGFTAHAGSYFHARIGNCNTTPSPGGCN